MNLGTDENEPEPNPISGSGFWVVDVIQYLLSDFETLKSPVMITTGNSTYKKRELLSIRATSTYLLKCIK